MTPRESLEAAGWTPANNYAIWWHVNSNGWITQAEALAQLARDEAKETSDGRIRSGTGTSDGSQVCGGDDPGGSGGDRRVGTGEVSGTSSGANVAPVATSVPAPDERFVKWLWEKYPEIALSSQALAPTLVAKLATEYASSSSAALLAANEVIRRQLKKVCDQAEAAEAKCAELQGWKESQIACTPDYQEIGKLLDVRWGESVHDKIIPEIRALRDSRDRLQGALRAAANHLHYVGQEQAAGQARAALGDPK